MAKYRKKLVVIEAEQFFPTETPWPEGVEQYVCDKRETVSGQTMTFYGWRIQTLEGPMEVRPSDWIITGVEGERYPCKKSVFEQTYERGEEKVNHVRTSSDLETSS